MPPKDGLERPSSYGINFVAETQDNTVCAQGLGESLRTEKESRAAARF